MISVGTFERSAICPYLQYRISKLNEGKRSTEAMPVFVRLTRDTWDTELLRKSCTGPFRVFGSIAATGATADSIVRLSQCDDVEYVELPPRGKPSRGDTFATVNATAAAIGLPLRTGEGVVVGIIDSGMDYLNPQFMGRDGSRIRHLGIQARNGFIDGYDWPADPSESSDQPLNGSASSHGTRVASIAAGLDGVAPGAEIIAVNTTYFAPHVAIAVEYIFAKARQLGRRAVVNLSLNFDSGPRDGTSSLDLALWELLRSYREHVLVASTGNQGGNTHRGGKLCAGERVTLEWTQHRTDAHLEVWLTNAEAVSIEQDGSLKVTAAHIGRRKSGSIVAVPDSGSRHAVTLYNRSADTVLYHSWLSGDGTLARGNRDYTVASPATAYGVIAVGAMAGEARVADYSGRGPTVADRAKPDVVAPGAPVSFGDQIPLGSAVAGTSWAAPYVTGAVALMIEQDEPMVVDGGIDTPGPQLRATGSAGAGSSEVKHCFWNITACIRKTATLPAAAESDPDNGVGGVANSWGRGILNANAALACEDDSQMPAGPPSSEWQPALVRGPDDGTAMLLGSPSQADPGWRDVAIYVVLAWYMEQGTPQSAAVAYVSVSRDREGAGIEQWQFVEGAGAALAAAETLVITGTEYDEPLPSGVWPPASLRAGDLLQIPAEVSYSDSETAPDVYFEFDAGASLVRLRFVMEGDEAKTIEWYRNDGEDGYLVSPNQAYSFSKVTSPDWSDEWTEFIWPEE